MGGFRQVALRPSHRMNFTTQAVLQMAPDDASAKAAKGLASPAKWGSSLGFSERAAWGECQGSGSKPYQTQVAFNDGQPSFKCSCPSRKFPCKHGLALMLLKAQSEQLFSTAGEPAWVSQWLDSRVEREQRKQEKAQAIEADPVASQKAAAASDKKTKDRWSRIEKGLDDLELFLVDQLNAGLASLGANSLAAWQQMAARMVDAQAQALSDILLSAIGLVGKADNWPSLLMAQMGRVQLCIEAVRHRDKLSPDELVDLQAALGWAIDSATAISKGIKVEDVWLVLGSVTDVRNVRMIERRTWLYGMNSGQRALVLEYSVGGKGFERVWEVASAFGGTMAFYQSAAPLRAVPVGVLESTLSPSFEIWPAFTMDEELMVNARQLSANPLTLLMPMMLADVMVTHKGGCWWLHPAGEGARVALQMRVHDLSGWDLMAASADNGIKVAGEWDGEAFRPMLAIGKDGHLVI